MTVAAADLLFKFSTKAGAAGNANASNGASSLGKYISTTQLTSASLHDLFDEITGTENAASEAEYRCVFLHNNHATDEFSNASIYILSEVAGGASVAIGVDPTAASAIGSAGAQAVEIADENTAPVGVVFSSPVVSGGALDMGDIPAGQCKAFWVRRTAANTAAIANDGCTLRVRGESV